MTTDSFYWQLVDPDRPAGESFREGDSYDALVSALRDLTAFEDEHVPEGFIASGNIRIYWSRRAVTTPERRS